MYGWINNIVEKFVLTLDGGNELWQSIKHLANCDVADDRWEFCKAYPDELTFHLLGAASRVLDIAETPLLESLGSYLIIYSSLRGFDTLLRCQGHTLVQFLKNIDEMHSHLHFAIGDISPSTFPVFYCEADPADENVATFSYKSHRGSRLCPLVVGAVKEVAKSYFQSTVQMDRLTTQGIGGCEFTSWRITISKSHLAAATNLAEASKKGIESGEEIAVGPHPGVSSQMLQCPFSSMAMKSDTTIPTKSSQDETHHEKSSACAHPPNNSAASDSTASDSSCSKQPKSQQQQLTADDKLTLKSSLLDGGLLGVQMRNIFPFHIIVNRHFVITHVGDKLNRFIPEIRPGVSRIDEIFSIKEPESCDWSWSRLCVRKHSSFVLETVLRDDAVDEDDEVDDARVRRLSGGLYFIGVGCPKEKFNTKGVSVGNCDAVGQQTATGGGAYCDMSNGKEGEEDLFSALFLVQPDVESFSEMIDCNITMSDFPKHSSQPKLIRLSESLQSETYISEKSRAETASANRLLDMKRTFVRYVSHEVRTPLNTVSMGLKLIQSLNATSKKTKAKVSTRDDGKDALKLLAEVFVMAEEIRESCDIAVDILDDLLLYEKLEGNILAIDKVREAAVPLVFSTVKSFLIQARQAEVALECSFDGDVFHEEELLIPTTFIDIDKAKVSQALRNLISNAIKFIPANNTGNKANDRRVTVHLSVIHKLHDESVDCDEDGGGNAVADLLLHPDGDDDPQKQSWSKFGRRPFFRVQVTDCGPGISVDNQKLLFKQIIQFDPAKLQGGRGSGLGLFISKGIMDLHGGSIGVHSEGEGKGSCFFLDFPISHTTSPKVVSGAVGVGCDVGSGTGAAGIAVSFHGEGPTTEEARLPLPLYQFQLQSSESIKMLAELKSSASEKSISAESQSSIRGVGGGGGGGGMESNTSGKFSTAASASRNGGYSSKPSMLLAEWRVHSMASSPQGQGHRHHRRRGSSSMPPDFSSRRNSAVMTTPPDTPSFGFNDELDHSAVGKFSPPPASALEISPLSVLALAEDAVYSDGDLATSNPVVSPPKNPIQMRLVTGDTPGGTPDKLIAVSSVLERRESKTAVDNSDKSDNKNRSEPTLKVLVVDDSVATRKMIMRFLRLNKLCADPLEASDGAEAVALVKAHLASPSGDSGSDIDTDRSSGTDTLGPIEAILMDFIMPVMDGPTATKEIRDLGYKGLIVGLTGNVLPEDKSYFKAKGADEVLAKPADMVQLTSILRKHCVDREIATSPPQSELAQRRPVEIALAASSPLLPTLSPLLSSQSEATVTEVPQPSQVMSSWSPGTGTPAMSRSIIAAARITASRGSGGSGGGGSFSQNRWRSSNRLLDSTDLDAESSAVTEHTESQDVHFLTNPTTAALRHPSLQYVRTNADTDTGYRLGTSPHGSSERGHSHGRRPGGGSFARDFIDNELLLHDGSNSPTTNSVPSPLPFPQPLSLQNGNGYNDYNNYSRISPGTSNSRHVSHDNLRSATLTRDVEGGGGYGHAGYGYGYGTGSGSGSPLEGPSVRNFSQKIPRNAVAPLFFEGSPETPGPGNDDVRSAAAASSSKSNNTSTLWSDKYKRQGFLGGNSAHSTASTRLISRLRRTVFKNTAAAHTDGCTSAPPANLNSSSAFLASSVGAPRVGNRQSVSGTGTSSKEPNFVSPGFLIASFFSSLLGGGRGNSSKGESKSRSHEVNVLSHQPLVTDDDASAPRPIDYASHLRAYSDDAGMLTGRLRLSRTVTPQSVMN